MIEIVIFSEQLMSDKITRADTTVSACGNKMIFNRKYLIQLERNKLQSMYQVN
jgi:hypothetical protein